MNDDQLLREVGSWLVDAEPDLPDARESVRQAMARTPTLRQRGRWWPLPIVEPSGGPPTMDQTSDFQPSPNQATNGQTPTVIGRTQSMFSPAKAISAGAVIFAIGGVMLVAQPFQQQGSVPGAATDDPIPPALVTGTIVSERTTSPGTTTSENGVTRIEGYTGALVWEADDPRLSGDVTYTGNWQRYENFYLQAEASIFDLVNEDGRWVGRATALANGPGIDDSDTILFIGEDGYEGLTAYINLDWSTEPATFSGGVISGDWPAFPSPE